MDTRGHLFNAAVVQQLHVGVRILCLKLDSAFIVVEMVLVYPLKANDGQPRAFLFR